MTEARPTPRPRLVVSACARRALLVLLSCPLVWPGVALAQDADPSTPPPPPATVGTPVEGSDFEPPALPEPEPSPSPAVVRTPGGVGLRYLLEGIEVRGNKTTRTHIVRRYVPFRPGMVLDVNDKELELTRFRLLGTGFFQDVQLSLRRGSHRGAVILVVEVTERNTIVVNDVWLGLSTDADASGEARPLTAYGGLDVAETNLGGSGVTLGGAVVLADRQLALRTRFADPQFLGLPWTLEAQLLYNKARDYFGLKDVLVDDPAKVDGQDYAVASYRRFGGLIGVGRDLDVSTQLFAHYRLESIDATLPRAASDRRGLETEPIDFRIAAGGSLLSTLGATLVHDTRDEPVLPSRGGYLVASAEAALAPLGSDYAYGKLDFTASRWAPLPWLHHVLRVEGKVGAIFGGAPLFEQFYVGDLSDLLPDRVLGLNFDRRTAPNLLGTSIAEKRYGHYAARLLFEYRVPLYRGYRSVYGADVFTAFGLYGLADDDNFTNHPRGYDGLSAAPIDLTFNVGLRVSTSVGGFAFGISNLLGLIPVRRDAR